MSLFPQKFLKELRQRLGSGTREKKLFSWVRPLKTGSLPSRGHRAWAFWSQNVGLHRHGLALQPGSGGRPESIPSYTPDELRQHQRFLHTEEGNSLQLGAEVDGSEVQPEE